MPNRPIGRRVAVVVLSALSLATVGLSPVSAQGDDDDPPPPTTPIIFTNTMTNAERPNGPDEQWQVQVTARALNNCTSELGETNYTSHWINAGDDAAALFGLKECVYEIDAKARDASGGSDCAFPAQVAWGTNPGDSDYTGVTILSTGKPDSESRLSIRRAPGGACRGEGTTRFTLDGATAVTDLPGASADAELLVLARRAAELAEYDVLLQPDYRPGESAPSGCEETYYFTIRGDGTQEHVSVTPSDEPCRRRATIVQATPPLVAPEGIGVSFEDTGGNILVALASLVRMPQARISIVQEVAGSLNRGEAMYAVLRECGDFSDTIPGRGSASVPLSVGRFTVHSPAIPTFGPVYTYPAVAARADSDDIVGCSVTVIITSLPDGCSAPAGEAQLIDWSDDPALTAFDFVFDITCGTETSYFQPLPPPAPAPPPPPAAEVGPVPPPAAAPSPAAEVAPVPPPAREVGPVMDMFAG